VNTLTVAGVVLRSCYSQHIVYHFIDFAESDLVVSNSKFVNMAVNCPANDLFHVTISSILIGHDSSS